jgi:hypothetical protein
LAASPERWALFSNSSTVHLAADRAASSGPGLISC